MIFRKRPNLAETLTVPEPEQPTEAQEENPFVEAANELAGMERDGALPEGFALSEAVQDPAFAQLLMELPAKAAVRVYMAERKAEQAERDAREKLSETIRVRNALPKSTRADRAVAATPDYMNMSEAAFRMLEQQYKNAAHSGKRVHI